MSMSDEVAGAALQVSMQAAEKSLEIGQRVIDSMIDNIAKLLQAISAKEKQKSPKSTDLSEIKSGIVSMSELVKNAKKNGDTLSTSENALTKDDMKKLTRMAKNYGIPIAFTSDKHKENNYANVRTSDLQIFQKMCTDLMKDKLAERPQELGNFKAKDWEIPFITNELNNYDLSAQFGVTKDGEKFCLYEKSDEKAIMIARNEFVKKCDEINANMTVTKNENFFVIQDKHSGKEISFEDVPSREELSEQIQKNFGYDKNKADIACAKFGEENLHGEEKKKFFSKNPQNNFSKVDTNITLQNESIYTKNFTCWRVTPKSDRVPKIVFQDENGRFAVLNPEKMTKAKMADILQKSLLISDRKTIEALVDKAEKVTDYYSKQNEKNFSFDYKFSKSDFDMTNPETVSNMIRTDENGNTFTKKLPTNSISNDIQRTGKDEFLVKSTVNVLEFDQNENEHISSDTQQLVLSFSDKKNAIHQLMELYKKQGISEDVAKQISKEVFSKAESQSAEKVLNIEEIRAETQAGKTETKVIVKSGNQSEEVEISDPEKAVEEISKKFDVSPETAETVIGKVQEDIQDKKIIVVDDIPEEIPHEFDENDIPPIPDDWHFNENDIPPEIPDFAGDMPEIPDAPDVHMPTPRGRR
ncbi:MAG: PcfB family protein [Ruminococcus flavefaciens]|nr:PcfB family protein [Ruminococcus flavefaciens]